MATHDFHGNNTHFSYDKKGRLVKIEAPLQRLTTLTYSEQQQTITAPNGAQIIQTLNQSGNVIKSVNPLGQATLFNYDEFGRVIKVTDAQGQITKLHYGDSRRFYKPQTIVYPNGARFWEVYEGEGNVKYSVDPEGNRSYYEYAPFDLLKKHTDGDGREFCFDYDREQRLKSVTNGKGECWSFTRDTVGRVCQETDFAGRTLQFEYDAASQLIKKTNPDGSYLTYEYDDDGALITQTLYGLDEQSQPYLQDQLIFNYNDAGDLNFAKNQQATVIFKRDEIGRIIEETINGISVQKRYDLMDNLIEQVSALTTTQYGYDLMGQLSELQIDKHAPLTLTRDALGREIARKLSGGFELYSDYNEVGQLIKQTAYQKNHAHSNIPDGANGAINMIKGIPTLQLDSKQSPVVPNFEKLFEYNLNGHLIQQSDNRDPKVSQYITSNTGLLKGVAHGFGSAERFGWDNTGNIMGHKVVHTGNLDDTDVQEYQNHQGGQPRIVMAANGDRILFEYDKCGRVVKRTKDRKGFRPETTYFSWDAQSKLIEAKLHNGQTWQYNYDCFGRRLSKICIKQQVQQYKTRHTFYLWSGNLAIAQTDTIKWGDNAKRSGERDQENESIYTFHPNSFVPIALQYNKQLGYAIVDQIGTATEFVGETGETIWRRKQMSFGGDLPDDHPFQKQLNAANDETFQCHLRFQGQWFDQETGLSYNRFRYYDANAGYYLSPDPIGIAGGLQNGLYVPNPMSWVDGFGLEKKLELSAKAAEERVKLNAGKDRNVSIIDYNIEGKTGQLVSVSGTASRVGSVGLPMDPMFNPIKVGGFMRSSDAEYKLLENIAKGLTPNSSGVINLFTELPPCKSCAGILEQFSTKFPKLESMYLTTD